ncbi:hypothetical protein BJY04DRAFT_211077 [Aspergillus karnatakaensis]|uniref:uncharacterized protein n=1 Tax=Aspergillus karnatakaensis TaxID=1810916 RepID=UPI003CCCCC42
MAAILLLILLSLSVFYTIFYVSSVNGSNDLAQAALAAGKLPGSDAPLRTVYTGIGFIDDILTILTIFFWPNAEAGNPALLIHSVAFTGTFSSAWVLVTLEAWRSGNACSIVSYSVLFGLLAQIMTFAFATPLYLAIHLYLSVTATNPTVANIHVPRIILKSIPLVFIPGFYLPTSLLLIPAPAQVSTDLKQIFIAIWQFWPAYISFMLTTIRYLSPSPTADANHSTLRPLRCIYALTFANTAIPHIISWTIPLASVATPWLFNPVYLESLHPGIVFFIPRPWDAKPLTNLADGAHSFLRWDYLIGSAGVLVWAVALYIAAHKKVSKRIGSLEFGAKIFFLTLVAGPVGAAVELVWERDELVFEQGDFKRVDEGKKLL